jgi:hypothetical protein
MRKACVHPIRRTPPREGPSRERGIAALALTMVLFFAMVLGIGFVNRNLIFEQRASANQYRSTQAFEAAEAGLEWALARLNDNRRIGTDCLPSADATAVSFRDRYLSYERPSASFSATRWSDAGVATPLLPSCVRGASGWDCSCPAAGPPNLAAVASHAAAPAFVVQFQDAGRPGLTRVVATGCTSLDGVCVPGSSSRADATARVQVLFGLLPALRTAPAAALTVRGTVDADAAAFGAHNADAASGLAIHAGGAIHAAAAQLTVPPGASAAAAVAAGDSALAALNAAQFFATWFGIDAVGWANQPAAHRLFCSDDCTAALLATVANDAGSSLVRIDGDLQLAGPATFGTPEHPIVLVANGTIRLSGPVAVYGVVYGASLRWSDTAGTGALVRGAVISEGDYGGDGAPQFVYDIDVLAQLKGNAGTFARVDGSWRDF